MLNPTRKIQLANLPIQIAIEEKQEMVLDGLERKEDLQIAIEDQQEMGLDGLEVEDKYLMKIGGCRGIVNLDDLEIKRTSAEHQASWLQSVEAARNAFLSRRQQAQAARWRNQQSQDRDVYVTSYLFSGAR